MLISRAYNFVRLISCLNMEIVGRLCKHLGMGIFDKVKKITEAIQTASNSPVTSDYGKFVVLDVETTGLDPEVHRIIEIALVTVENGTATEAWTSRFNPEGPVGKTEIHGITDADVKHAPKFRDLVTEVLSRTSEVAVVAHNARFDLAFLRAEFERAGIKSPWIPSICTMNASNYYQPYLSRRRLQDCCEDIGIEIENAHSAAGDAIATAKLFHYFLSNDKEPLPRQQDLETVRNPSSQVYQASETSPKSNYVRDQIKREASSRAVRPNQSVVAELGKLLKACSFAEILPEESFEGQFEYLEKVVESLSDGNISESESAELSAVAKIYSLTEQQIDMANRSLLKALAIQALKDESISVLERDELSDVAVMLGLPKNSVTEVVKDAKELRANSLSRNLLPLPDSWKLGEPLRVGQKVVFTGCDPEQRASLEKESRKLGVAISSGVSKKTSLLITDGSYVGNKANDAAKLGVRVVTPDEFEFMLKYIQPAETNDSGITTGKTSSQPGAEGLDPADVRAWAIKNGIEVSPKGRIHSDVYELYKKSLNSN